MTQAYFVTGTDTGCGKTLIAAALLIAAAARGHSVLGLKPVAAGCELRDGVWANDDAWALAQLATKPRDYRDINPVALREPMAPHIAAEREQVRMQARELAQQVWPLLNTADFTVIEGAGGWLVPINATETMASVAEELGVPVILVVGMRLGCINHALLTASAIARAKPGLAGWVANVLDPDMAALDENIAALSARLPAPLIGTVPRLDKADSNLAATHLDITRLQNATAC